MDLHHIQKYCWLNCLELETRKKVFWCQYTLEKCISASSGAPTLIRELEVSTEYPSDVDDGNLIEQGFLPGLSGELTKITSALAFFKICRILSRALDQLVPASVAYWLSISDMKSISDELDQWLKCIPTHLRMKFLNDEPSTGVITDRSPLLPKLRRRPLLTLSEGSDGKFQQRVGPELRGYGQLEVACVRWIVERRLARSDLPIPSGVVVSTLTNPHDWLDQEWPVGAIDLPTKGLASQSVLSTSQESMTSGGEDFSGCGSNDGSSSPEQTDVLDVGRRSLKGIPMLKHDKFPN
ncbi:hypothetical protein EPUS_02619 [Endocarpon pusillum Z07020]|uniref:Xylanolytic transcriptional activator regulatory domain-containing protein n=1 Tax=Endocarpon pusillum (strain Z07020 / HMAS-L-300199) TaxID=1263415 RepID=U1GWN7_ENDPU|nr:uncharacterized protein EPUS_02619 [Endocarpon pusillum Z07020]ERF76908.1 hypothetical protein EPUS_02619 [Endocarpon pusillum Z07020]